jgi:hypothetical protein
MRNKFLYMLSATLILTFTAVVSYSQVQIGLHGSRLEGTNVSQWGFGGNVKFLIADKFAIGVAARAYPNKDMKTVDFSSGGNNYKMVKGNTIVPVTASLDYYFGKAPIRPYLGVDAGAYFRKQIVAISNAEGNSSAYNTTDKGTFFGAAPRAGLNIELGPIGIFGQAGYNFLFGSGSKDNLSVPGFNTDIDTKPVDKFWTFDAGIFFKFGGHK